MAGIGFVFRKLLDQDNLGGSTRAYFHGAIGSSGPWLLTVIALSILYALSDDAPFSAAPLIEFRVILLYNFAFSLVATAPVSIISTRYLSDLIYAKQLKRSVGMLIGSLTVVFALATSMASIFYFGYVKIPPSHALLAVMNFVLISGVWQVMIFVSALKQYTAVTTTFMIGLLFSIIGGYAFIFRYGFIGLMGGFNSGVAFILISLLALILAEYPKASLSPFRFLRYFKKYWELALGSLFYTMAIWADKWVMWFAPESIESSIGLRVYPYYDSAMLVSYLTIVPAMSVFLIMQETSFYLRYLQFYGDIQSSCNLDKILLNQEKIMSWFVRNSKGVAILQMSVCLGTLLSAPQIFKVFGMNFIQMGIFRLGVLGATFHIFALFIMILLSYFEERRGAMWIQGVFLFTNTIFTWISIRMGFPYYGYGYFLSALVTFAFAGVMLERVLRELPYRAFVVNNTAIRKER